MTTNTNVTGSHCLSK